MIHGKEIKKYVIVLQDYYETWDNLLETTSNALYF
jgi:hypothetical protein